MFKIGCHLSSTDGFLKMGENAVSIGANTFQFFSRNPRGGTAKELDLNDINKFNEFAKENGIGKIIAHAPYTMNAASKTPRIRAFSHEMLKDDLERLEHIPDVLYNFHPGSHTGLGVEAGTDFIADMLNEVLDKKFSTTVLLETMSGKGTEIGRSFEEIRDIIAKVKLKNKLGVCLDTCHVFDGGYDIAGSLDEVLAEFDEIIGLENLHAIHLNDSKNILGSHKDRHAQIGEGNIGFDAIRKIINHPKLRMLPFVLETPHEDLLGYKKEIAWLKENYK